MLSKVIPAQYPSPGARIAPNGAAASNGGGARSWGIPQRFVEALIHS